MSVCFCVVFFPPCIPRNCSSVVNAFPVSLTCMYALALHELDQLLTAWGRNFVVPGDSVVYFSCTRKSPWSVSQLGILGDNFYFRLVGVLKIAVVRL